MDWTDTESLWWTFYTFYSDEVRKMGPGSVGVEGGSGDVIEGLTREDSGVNERDAKCGWSPQKVFVLSLVQ